MAPGKPRGGLQHRTAAEDRANARRSMVAYVTDPAVLWQNGLLMSRVDAIDAVTERRDVLATPRTRVQRARRWAMRVSIPRPRSASRFPKGELTCLGCLSPPSVPAADFPSPVTSASSSLRPSRVVEAHETRTPSNPNPTTTVQSSPYNNAEVPLERDRDDWWYNGTEHLFLNRSGEHHFVGASSTTHLAKRLNPTSTNLAWDVRPLYDDPSSLRRAAPRVLPQLPPFEYAKRLYWVQYVYIGTIFSLIQPDDFEERLHIVYNQPPDLLSRESCLVYCQVLLVIAFGLMYSVNQWSGDEGPPGFKYFKHALRFLPDIHEEGSIFFVEVLCYVAYYMQNLNRRDAAFLYIGLALRMAISLGLHQEVLDPGIGEEDRNRRRRAWWSVYSLDRLLSVKSGNPITIHDEDIGTTWPQPISATDVVPWPSVVLTYYTQLSRILGRIGEEIYRKKPRSGSNLLASVQSITDELSDWLRRIPDRLRIDFSRLGTHINRESVSIFLHFYSCVNMTARPLVFYVIQRQLDAEAGSATNDWRQGLSQNTVAVIESCIAAARATTLIMDAAAKHNLIATYGYLDGEYVFSAALLLVMVNAAFPHNEANARAMELSMTLLRNMADRGNTNLAARHSLLLELRSSIGPNRARKDGEVADAPVTPSSTQQTPSNPVVEPPAGTTMLAPHQDLPSMQEISFNFDINDDPGLWEEVLDQIDIDMDTDWIENTLKRQQTGEF
ncbi:C6 transcription factor [Aspergillus heteromorphus CBS 117.55]|uniref:C6 transcription factor n=1 Tax=Aspergillus heteromorphus CBS 117.55 TaxID=1448321 RepID=A0A317WSB6_9EURO|nr:C6 transcription factor [Aspergillus heteromorphus CBS 117.55]PWY88222.1 C6 transcription factor [Aspergillus heteromorphus CBS 117.55]